MSLDPSTTLADFERHGSSKAGKKESAGHRRSRLCQPCATPSSNSSLNYRRSDARIAENGFATSRGVSKSAKVVLGCSITVLRGIAVAISPNVILEEGVVIFHKDLVNLYGCRIGAGTKIGAFVEIQKNAHIGKACKISSHSFICEGVEIEDEVFVGHGVTFINDRFPRATTDNGQLQTEANWTVHRTRVRQRASIGSNATILPNIIIGVGALVGAGAVVTRDVPEYAIVSGNPARIVGDVRDREKSQ
jgi:UDP-2-acetamido-3-amino-2,3-dideoxy-glucuronate N-acetyltransferase